MKKTTMEIQIKAALGPTLPGFRRATCSPLHSNFQIQKKFHGYSRYTESVNWENALIQDWE